tara:strand:- start:682 stop:996 length:315 start_codon:yes stop_codon:yes gene_type:complete
MFEIKDAPIIVPIKARANIGKTALKSICLYVDAVEPIPRKREPTLILPTMTPNELPGKKNWMNGTEKNILPPTRTAIMDIKKEPITIKRLWVVSSDVKSASIIE